MQRYRGVMLDGLVARITMAFLLCGAEGSNDFATTNGLYRFIALSLYRFLGPCPNLIIP
jgi:hypothetical protein